MGSGRGGSEAEGGARVHARPDAPTPTPAPTSTPLTHLVSGPVGHVWYRRLDSFVSARVKRGSAAFVAAKASQEREKKETGPGRPGGAGAAHGASPTLPPHTSPFLPPQVGLDEAVFGPVHVAGYFAAVVAAAGGGVADVQAKARRDGWSGGVGWAGVRGPPAGPGHAKPALSARGRPCPTTRAFTTLKKPSRQTLALTPLALTPLAITPLALTPLAFTNPDAPYTLTGPLTQPLTTQPSHHTLCTHPVRFHPTLCPPTSRSSPFGPRFRPSIFGAFPCGIRREGGREGWGRAGWAAVRGWPAPRATQCTAHPSINSTLFCVLACSFWLSTPPACSMPPSWPGRRRTRGGAGAWPVRFTAAAAVRARPVPREVGPGGWGVGAASRPFAGLGPTKQTNTAAAAGRGGGGGEEALERPGAMGGLQDCDTVRRPDDGGAARAGGGGGRAGEGGEERVGRASGEPAGGGKERRGCAQCAKGRLM